MQYKENVCPKCGKDTSNLALEDLLINWETCDCDAEPSEHLVECRWHEECYMEVGAEALMAIVAEVSGIKQGTMPSYDPSQN